MGNDGENSAGTMRVLVADQEPEMLEAIARVFEVDVATSKATCIDLLRANPFDVVVACERLSDGSGLELLSQVGQRWPDVIRIFAIAPERRALLKGHLGPFKLFETLPYPIDEEKLEAALTRAAEALAAAEVGNVPDPRPMSASRNTAEPRPAARPPDPRDDGRRSGARGIPPSPTPAPRASVPAPRASVPAPRTSVPAPRPAALAVRTSAPGPRNVPPPTVRTSGASPPSRPTAAPPSAVKRGVRPPIGAPAYPPLPPKGSKIVPLGSPGAPGYRIVPHDYDRPSLRRMPPAQREVPKKTPTLPEKAAALAAEAMAAVTAVVRYIKPEAPTPAPPRATPRKRR